MHLSASGMVSLGPVGPVGGASVMLALVSSKAFSRVGVHWTILGWLNPVISERAAVSLLKLGICSL